MHGERSNSTDQDKRVTRTNIKALGAAIESGIELGRAELQRICYRAPGLES